MTYEAVVVRSNLLSNWIIVTFTEIIIKKQQNK